MTSEYGPGRDPHVLLFGPDTDPDADLRHWDQDDAPTRRELLRADRRRRVRRRTMSLVALTMVVVIAAAAWFVARPFIDSHFKASDYTGTGTGTVLVKVADGDGATDIGRSLHAAGVVASVRAFTDAAAADDASQSLQPGTYQMHRHMSAASALALMLAPGTRVYLKVTVPEGNTVFDVETKLAATLSVPVASVRDALAGLVSDSGLPVSYTAGGGAPTSAEGFLFPDTYEFAPGTTADDAVQQMVGRFTGEDKDLGFAQAAAKVHLTPYQALILASMIEGEAKFPEDRAKVARVVFNRLAQRMPLGIDATSLYGAQLAGRPASSVTYTEDSPYNTRNRVGLPPTPIDNPGAATLSAAVAPATGNWIYYVNGDAAGHLYFTASATDFEAAVARCKTNHWGCS